MLAEHGSQPAFSAGPLHSGADGGDRRDDPDASVFRRRGWKHPGSFHGHGAAIPPQRKGAAINAAAQFAHGAKITLSAQVLLRAEAHGAVPAGGRIRSNHRQPLAALQATGLDDLATAAGGHAGTVTNLAGAFLAVRAECRLHDYSRKRGSEVPDAARGVKARFVLSGLQILADFRPATPPKACVHGDQTEMV